MSNKLKKFIWDNRKAFDNETPADKVWENIEASFSPKKKKKFILTPVYKWSMAAAAMLIIATGFYFFANKKPGETTVVAKSEPDINKLAPEYASQMNQFVKMIDTKQEELKTIAKGLNLFSQVFIGGTSVFRDLGKLKRPSHFIIGTPGRLLDMENQRALKFSNFKTLHLISPLGLSNKSRKSGWRGNNTNQKSEHMYLLWALDYFPYSLFYFTETAARNKKLSQKLKKPMAN